MKAKGCQAVDSHKAPLQNATDADRGAKRGVQAVGPGNKEDTMEACTPPMLKPLIPAIPELQAWYEEAVNSAGRIFR